MDRHLTYVPVRNNSGNRTHTPIKALDPESKASTSFAILLVVMLFRHYAFLSICATYFTTDDLCSATELRPHFLF